MRSVRRVLLAAAVSLLTGPAVAKQVVAAVGFEGPEAARYDDVRDEYLVSNLGGTGAGNDGFISRVGPDGAVRELKWIEGGRHGVTLVNPLGVYLKGDLVYVADVAAVRLFDRRTGAPRGTTAVPDAVRLNDLVVADDGTIYVTDSGSDEAPGAIYKLGRAGGVALFARRDPVLERPNGIAITADGNIIHGGRGVNLSIRTPGGELLREITLPSGRFDGIVLMPSGDLLVASQDGHTVYRLPAGGGKPVVVAEDIAVPAAIGLDPKRMRLLVPQIRAASLSIYELGGQAAR